MARPLPSSSTKGTPLTSRATWRQLPLLPLERYCSTVAS